MIQRTREFFLAKSKHEQLHNDYYSGGLPVEAIAILMGQSQVGY